MRPLRLEYDPTGPVPKLTLALKQYYIRDPENQYVLLYKNPPCKYKSTKRLGCYGGRYVTFCLKKNRIVDATKCCTCKTREE